MRHQTKVVEGGRPLTFNWFCTCGEFGFGYRYSDSALFVARSHEWAANAHDEQLEETGQCIHGGCQRDKP